MLQVSFFEFYLEGGNDHTGLNDVGNNQPAVRKIVDAEVIIYTLQ